MKRANQHRRGLDSTLTTAASTKKTSTKTPKGWYAKLSWNIPRTAQLKLRVRPQPGQGSPVANLPQQIGIPRPCGG